ncbi:MULTISPECIES: DUF3043 domain-containing protein [Micromonospora]|uniref:DUF3043 domain-containing protein n=1 Tax=Micromonospora chalcea TaxID=1874 RepID=A0ABX9Y4D8_MICCH|nr:MULTISPECIES: DUF3043 domain-containing protein [Micromonospora]MBC8991618.1 DUF3043 domain-containing protein [Micromonospora chalcea]MBP1784770.1 hypothetical protein [Micromonospora sp. HB375]MBQ1063492.1 DUF3043 domain-containing protein [Micromonospora sp. C41]MBQ1071380.1 DUF3043 domain-containing protein [Micromonospora sp. D75]MCK1806356.1 DUF3043 domain-containing protein [Micromonospora sp. R42106]
MPSLFRRKSADLVEESVTTVTTDEESAAARPRGYTPSKKELGQVTPKRPVAGRRPTAPAKPLTKEEARAQRRAARAEAAAEFRREGGPRDRGPERLLARNVVDSRRTVGTWFFGGALIVLVGSNQAMPPIVRLLSNLLWGALALGVLIDSVLISRKIKRLVRERFPKSTEKLGSLYFYAIMRSITFRRMRAPAPRVNIGDKV